MQSLDFSQYEPMLFVVVGLIALLIPIIKRDSALKLKESGVKAEGIIYKQEIDSRNNSDFENSSSSMDKVIVRFVTKDSEWITSEIKQPFALFFSGQYKPGDKVDIYYDPKKPTDFHLDTKQSDLAGRILFAIIGLIFFFIGLYKLFR